jgi:hypothetical protein
MKNRIDAAKFLQFFVQRSLDDYKRLPSSVRAEVRDMAARGYARHPSDEAMAWWLRLPGLPRDNRAVFAAIKNGAH